MDEFFIVDDDERRGGERGGCSEGTACQKVGLMFLGEKLLLALAWPILIIC